MRKFFKKKDEAEKQKKLTKEDQLHDQVMDYLLQNAYDPASEDFKEATNNLVKLDSLQIDRLKAENEMKSMKASKRKDILTFAKDLMIGVGSFGLSLLFFAKDPATFQGLKSAQDEKKKLDKKL